MPIDLVTSTAYGFEYLLIGIDTCWHQYLLVTVRPQYLTIPILMATDIYQYLYL